MEIGGFFHSIVLIALLQYPDWYGPKVGKYALGVPEGFVIAPKMT